MLLPCVFALAATTFIASLVLSFHGVVGSENHTRERRELKECTESGIFRCYWEYTTVLRWPPLQRNDAGEFNDENYREACRVVNTTSFCYEGYRRCRASMRRNFTRREEGYRTFRALVCDTEVLKSVIRAWNCTYPDKMVECIMEQTGDFNETDPEYEYLLCSTLQAQRGCYEKWWNSSCPMSLESAVAAVGKSLDAIELMSDCKSMYHQEPGLNDRYAASFSNLTADVERMRAILQENVKAIASLAEKIDIMQEGNERLVKESAKVFKQQTASMESIEGGLHELRTEIARRCRSQ